MACLAVAPALVGCGPAGSARSFATRQAPAATDAVEVTPQCVSAVVEGVDVFDGQGAVDWPAVRDAGVGFALIKATQGTYDTQATFARNWRASADAGVLRGAYHFFDPTEDGAAQAAHFLSVLDDAAPGDLPPVLDVECPDGDADCLGTGAPGLASAADIRARMDAFLAAVTAALRRAPMIYTFSSYFADNGVDAAGLDAYPLYLAWIPSDGAGDADAFCLDVPAPWPKAEVWQYSFEGTVAGISGAVNRDRFLGPLSALRALAGSGPPAVVGCP